MIERHIFINAWQSMKGWEKTNFEKLNNRLLSYSLLARGWKTHLFKIASNIGSILACLLVHPTIGMTFDIALIDNTHSAETSVLYSVIRSSYALKPSNYTINDLPEEAKPENHALFYANIQNISAFDFLLNSSILSKKNNPKDFVEKNLEKFELTYLDKVITEQIVPPGKFPAVSYSCNKYWEPMTWGKISIKGVNKWPHPLA